MKAGQFLLWADLEPDGLAALDATTSEESFKATLKELLKLEGPALRMDVLLELYTNTLRFAREHGFSVEKASTFFSIIKRNHEEMAEAFLPPHKSWEYLKVCTGCPHQHPCLRTMLPMTLTMLPVVISWQSLLLAHSVQRPPYSVGIFTLAEVQLITEFALTHYYAHFKLYRYAFTLKHVKEVHVRLSWAELPPASFPSLSEGVPYEPAPPPSEAPAVEPIEIPPITLDVDVPDAVKKACEEQIAAQVAAMRAQLEQDYADRAAQHEEQIAKLEAAIAK